MKKFLFRLLFFLIPLLLLASVPVYILHQSKENFFELDPVITGDDKYLIGYAYNDPNFFYLKWKTLKSKERYDVISIGSSRVLQFRKEMFNKPFYNGGYTTVAVHESIKFLKSLPKEKYPKYLMIGLDQWMFNEAWEKVIPKVNSDKWEKSFSKYPNLGILKMTWTDFLTSKYKYEFPDNDTIRRVGLNAMINNKGFRPDGSMDYGNQINKLLENDTTYKEYKYRDTYERINKGIRRFQFGNVVNPKAIHTVDNLLKFCQEHNIKLIAFLPPFADGVYDKLMSTGKHQYVGKIYGELVPLFKKYNSEIYDFSAVRFCNSNDTETIDGFHGGEVTYTKLMIKMLESGSVLNSVSDVKKLKTDVARPINRYSVYK